MEHILFHWDDIVDLMVDELITEEVQERNAIEAKLMGHHSQPSTYRSEEDFSELPIPKPTTILDRKQ
jgi:hypothetical protein